MPGRYSNNPLGDLCEGAKARRDPVEDALANIYRAMLDMEEIAMRLEQASRTAAETKPVLQPAAERLSQVMQRLAILHHSLGKYWRDGQAHRWD